MPKTRVHWCWVTSTQRLRSTCPFLPRAPLWPHHPNIPASHVANGRLGPYCLSSKSLRYLGLATTIILIKGRKQDSVSIPDRKGVRGRTEEPRAGSPHWCHYQQMPDGPTSRVSVLARPQSISCFTLLSLLGPSPVHDHTRLQIYPPLALLTL